jgi:hypothetical protein
VSLIILAMPIIGPGDSWEDDTAFEDARNCFIRQQKSPNTNFFTHAQNTDTQSDFVCIPDCIRAVLKQGTVPAEEMCLLPPTETLQFNDRHFSSSQIFRTCLLRNRKFRIRALLFSCLFKTFCRRPKLCNVKW